MCDEDIGFLGRVHFVWQGDVLYMHPLSPSVHHVHFSLAASYIVLIFFNFLILKIMSHIGFMNGRHGDASRNAYTFVTTWSKT